MVKGISVHQLKNREQVFTYKFDDTGEFYHVAVDRLIEYLKGSAIKPVDIAFYYELIEHLIKNNGAEPEHLEKIPLEALEVPGIILVLDDGETHVQCDGTHRAIKRAIMGYETYPAYLLPPKIWRRFLIDGFPTDIVDWDDFFINGKRDDPELHFYGVENRLKTEFNVITKRGILGGAREITPRNFRRIRQGKTSSTS